MVIGLYADPHFSQSSSIIVGRSGNFSGRLNNLINSFTWMNNLFKSLNVDRVVCLGDLVDKPVLSSEEITAMSQCNIDDHIIILGNHCRSDKDGNINAVSNYKYVINSPLWLCEDVYVLPYNSSTVDLTKLDRRPKIILSHNDIKGYSLNGHRLSSGYDVKDILENCDLFINGHLHNGGWVVKDRILNLGTISGINFSSCSGEWEPSVAVLDTETLEVKFYENPEAFRFKKVEFNTLPKLKGFINNLSGSNYVIQVKVPEKISQSSRKILDQSSKIYASRIITYKDQNSSKSNKTVSLITNDESIFTKLSKFIHSCSCKYDLSKIDKIIEEISTMTEGES